jgi:hypothetical protein
MELGAAILGIILALVFFIMGVVAKILGAKL